MTIPHSLHPEHTPLSRLEREVGCDKQGALLSMREIVSLEAGARNLCTLRFAAILLRMKAKADKESEHAN